MGQSQSELLAPTSTTSSTSSSSPSPGEIGSTTTTARRALPQAASEGTSKSRHHCVMKNQTTAKANNNEIAQQQDATTTMSRRLSNVSHRNIQLLSMKALGEMDAYADTLRSRRRSSLINLILGIPASGPRFSDDLCSVTSQFSDCTFGIEHFPAPGHAKTTLSSEMSDLSELSEPSFVKTHQRRRSSLESIVSQIGMAPASNQAAPPTTTRQVQLGNKDQLDRHKEFMNRLTSIDLKSSFEQHDRAARRQQHLTGRPIFRAQSQVSLYSNLSAASGDSSCLDVGGAKKVHQSSRKSVAGHETFNETKLIIILQVCLPFIVAGFGNVAAGLVLTQVCQWPAFKFMPTFIALLPPFIGLKGNIEMTLASRLSTLSNLNLLNSWQTWRRIYASNLVLILSQAIGLSLFAALASLTCEQLIISSTASGGGAHRVEVAASGEIAANATGSSYANTPFHVTILVVMAGSMSTAIILALISSLVMSLSVCLANLIRVNPDNLSTIVAVLYGDVSCIIVYATISSCMFRLYASHQGLLLWPFVAITATSTLLIWPSLTYAAYKFKETHGLALLSLPPMLVSIIISMGSGAILALVIDKFKLIALYQPVVNGFGANLIAVQASRVSTWLWCTELRKIPTSGKASLNGKSCGGKNQLDLAKNFGSIASIVGTCQAVANSLQQSDSLAHFHSNTSKSSSEDDRHETIGWLKPLQMTKGFLKKVFHSYTSRSPNAVAARLLLLMLIPAHSIYFIVIWLLAPKNFVTLTWQLYMVYLVLCLFQVFILLTICEPLMTLLMRKNLDPDVFGISILMALADLTGTLCLAAAFAFLAAWGDINAH